MWILTQAYNLYDQHGDYFITAWDHKPTVAEISIHLEEHFCSAYVEIEAKRLLETGGGRKNVEDEWFDLTEHKSGAKYEN